MFVVSLGTALPAIWQKIIIFAKLLWNLDRPKLETMNFAAKKAVMLESRVMYWGELKVMILLVMFFGIDVAQFLTKIKNLCIE